MLQPANPIDFPLNYPLNYQKLVFLLLFDLIHKVYQLIKATVEKLDPNGSIFESKHYQLLYYSKIKAAFSVYSRYRSNKFNKIINNERATRSNKQDNNSIHTEQHEDQEYLAQLLAKNDELVSPQRRFESETQPFNRFYEKWDKTQNKMDQKPINNFIELITQRYKQKQAALSIVDVGCGYGKQAYNMKKRLEANGVEIERFYGYDISTELIEIAKEKYGGEPRMQFFKRDLDTQFKDVAEFDVVISFCALHWVNDIKSTTEAIARSLKPKGLFLTLVGISKEQIYKIRVKFINNSKWSQCFEQNHRKVSHCYFYKNIYLDVFQKDFITLFECERSNHTKMGQYQCIEFLGKWIPEARHLIRDIRDEPRQEAILRAYTSDLIHSVPVGQGESLRRYEDNTYSVEVGYLEYQGVKN